MPPHTYVRNRYLIIPNGNLFVDGGGPEDFDDDHHIGPADLEQVLKLLTRSQLSAEEIVQVCEKVIEEADVDGDGKLSYMEFEHVILRAPDFLGTFHIRV